MASPPTLGAEPKLRDSCHACAASKLKCSKEKPACVRCLKRGKTCEYLVTRRAGRSRAKQPKKVVQVPTPESTDTHPHSLSTVDLVDKFPEAYDDDHDDDDHHHHYQDMLASPLHATDTQPFDTTPSDVDMMIEDYFTSPISLQLPELGDDSSSSSRNGSSTHDWNTHSQLLQTDLSAPLFDASALNFFAGPQPLSTMMHPASSIIHGNDMSFHAGSLPTDPHCGCLPRVLELLKQLCTTPPMHCTAWPGQKPDQGSASVALLQCMISENRHTLDMVSKMLPCPCSQDGYLLTTISLVVLKVMSRYETAAQHASLSTPGGSSAGSMEEDMTPYPRSGSLSAVMGCYNVDADDSDRMGAQIVLGELHRVQRLIKGLSERLSLAGLQAKDEVISHASTHHHSRPGVTAGVGGGSDILMTSLADATLPFYAPFFAQLESDLRKRLRRLSEQTADLVRRA